MIPSDVRLFIIGLSISLMITLPFFVFPIVPWQAFAVVQTLVCFITFRFVFRRFS